MTMIKVTVRFFWDYDVESQKAGPNWKVIVSLPTDETCYVPKSLTCNAMLAGEKLDPWWGYFDEEDRTRQIEIRGRICSTFLEAYEKALEKVQMITDEIQDIAKVRAEAGAQPVDFAQTFEVQEVQK